MKSILLAIASVFPLASLYAAPVTTTEALVAAVRDGAAGSAIEIAAGTFALKAPLEPKAGMTLTGAGAGKTIITNDPSWKPSTATLPDPEMRTKGMDTHAYLLRLQDKAADITVSAMSNPSRRQIQGYCRGCP